MKTVSTQLIHSFNHTEYTEGNFNGLTKREYFAAMAMQGLLSNTEGAIITYEDAARQAVSHADALIEALNK